jgi:hypothetical protein
MTHQTLDASPHCAFRTAAPKSDERLAQSAASLFGFSVGGACVFDASVGSKRFVTLGFIFPLHFIKRIARERI